MSHIVQRAWRPKSMRPHCAAAQRRFKTFDRRVDKNNEIYYTIAKRRPVQNPDSAPEDQQFFEMPNLLLDLDADGIKQVRTFEPKDEELQQAKWRVNPKREEVKLKLDDIEGKLMELRKRTNDIATSPSNIWRLTSHDILSAALHGPLNSSSPDTAENACLDSLEGSHLINALRRENGIPSHVGASDVLLLEWMLLRRHSTESAKATSGEEPLDSFALVQTIQSQSSIVGIRRLLLHSLRTRASIRSYFGHPRGQDVAVADVVGQIRASCIEILSSEEAHANQFKSCLALVGSLLEKLSWAGLEPEDRLQGLALRVAAQGGSFAALSELIHRIYSTRAWENGSGIVEDAAACMKSCTKLLALQPETAGSRQLLFQILTGIDENENLGTESLRSLAVGNLGVRVTSAVAHEACSAYATLLGELGAVRTLLKESQDTNKSLSDACITVLKSTPKYSEALKVHNFKSVSMEECVSKDYYDMGE